MTRYSPPNPDGIEYNVYKNLNIKTIFGILQLFNKILNSGLKSRMMNHVKDFHYKTEGMGSSDICVFETELIIKYLVLYVRSQGLKQINELFFPTN